jgi:predicted dithiol-disulfide oxidoreductase (DUF899 family)
MNTVLPHDQWLAAHAAHLENEKRLTKLRDALAQQRRELPWLKIDKTYTFDTPDGPRTLADLFDNRSQLIVKHFMLAPGWAEGCVGCSFEADHADGALKHIEHHDVTYVAVARAPLAEIEAFKRRMGWRFRWVSSYGSDFNYDFHVSATPAEKAAGKMYYNYAVRDFHGEEQSGHSAFFKDENGHVYHTFSAFGRGAEELLSSYVFLDMTAKGRNETGPRKNLTDWVRHHDRYGAAGHVDNTGRYRAATPLTTTGGCGCGTQTAVRS